jgi:hypothetical protein
MMMVNMGMTALYSAAIAEAPCLIVAIFSATEPVNAVSFRSTVVIGWFVDMHQLQNLVDPLSSRLGAC